MVVRPSPQHFSLGKKALSTSSTDRPAFARVTAAAEPAGGPRGAACAFSRARVASWGDRGVDAAAADAFRRGPRDPRGALVDCSDRPLLAMSVSDDGADVVAGGADHAAHGVDAARAGAKPQRQYHGKARGHHEWVTGVAHCGGRSVAPCGADGRLCLWRSPRACSFCWSASRCRARLR